MMSYYLKYYLYKIFFFRDCCRVIIKLVLVMLLLVFFLIFGIGFMNYLICCINIFTVVRKLKIWMHTERVYLSVKKV